MTMTGPRSSIYPAILLVLCINSAAWAIGRVGDPAPGFELQDTEGNMHRLSDYEGKIVLLSTFGYG